MKSISIYVEKRRLIGTDIKVANHFFTRLKGLMGKKSLGDSEGLYIVPCYQIHTFGMKMNIDVLFISHEGQILHCIQDMGKNQISPTVKGAKAVIELPAGSLKKHDITTGQFIQIQA